MNIKRFLASTMILGLSMGSLSNLAFASEEISKINENMQIKQPVTNTAVEFLSQEILLNKDFNIDDFIININNSSLESKFSSYIENNSIMVPLNDIATSLGFNVIWNQELSQIDINKGANFTSIKNNENRYFFSKMAPKKLSQAPKIINGTTYVPVEFFSDILRVNTQYDSKNKILNLGLNDKDVGNSTDIDKELITIDDETSDLNSKEFSKDEITRISNEETSKDSITIEGYIQNINTTERGTKMVQVGSFQKGVILLVDGETKITDISGNKVDFDKLTKDTKIQAVHSMVMTMSIPGQTRAFEIKVLNQ